MACLKVLSLYGGVADFKAGPDNFGEENSVFDEYRKWPRGSAAACNSRDTAAASLAFWVERRRRGHSLVTSCLESADFLSLLRTC